MASINMGASSSFFKSRKNNSSWFSKSRPNSYSPSTLARSQIFPDEGTSGNSRSTVDANMSLLRDRMEELRMKERLDACQNLQIGWNYKDEENCEVWKRQRQRQSLAFMSIELMSIFGSTIGLVFLTGSLCICTVKLIFLLSCNFQQYSALF